MIRVGETALYRLRITDPGDTITVTINGEFPYTLDQDGSIWTLNVTLSSLVEFNFTVIATDSFDATSAIAPHVSISFMVLCNTFYRYLGRAKASPTKARKRLFVCSGIGRLTIIKSI